MVGVLKLTATLAQTLTQHSFELLAGEPPFAAGHSSELQIYAGVVMHFLKFFWQIDYA